MLFLVCQDVPRGQGPLAGCLGGFDVNFVPAGYVFSIWSVIYLGLITYFVNWNGFGIAPEIWTIMLLAVATLVAGLAAYYRQDIAYLLVLIWAFVGIAVEQADTPIVANAA